MSDTLNPAQQEAVTYLDGPCLVIAGAGSGKTRVITRKIAHLIAGGVNPRAIAAITFTNKAAQEMAERLKHQVKLPEGNRPVVCTFHSLGVQMLREDMEVMPPVKISEVEKAQASITQLALRLEAEGKIIIAKAGAAEEFV